MKHAFTKIALAVTVLVIFSAPLCVFAANATYQLLVQDLPFIGKGAPNAEFPLAVYLDKFFSLGIAIAVLLAVLLFVYNGVMYMTSDIIGNKEEAKKNMQGVVGGLVLLFSIVLILKQINPDLVTFKLFDTLRSVSGELEKPAPTPTVIPPNTLAAEESTRAALKIQGIGVNQGPCGPGQGQPTCINVVGLGGITGTLSFLASKFGGCPDTLWPRSCPVTITGGTESGHQTHGPGLPIVDIKHLPEVTAFIKSPSFSFPCAEGASYNNLGPVWVQKDSYIYYFEESAGGLHWHICSGANYCPSFAAFCKSVKP